ncbi:protein kinase domain-containing protein [Desulfuribacillus alkaliarsenatis]|uniref:Protein kinase domain-containing protein n=1 Tax=Desulfuribacillus alkaliarsenatis TaxID=766136 RepID=A0A1E5FZ49_9FIRM|nr:protein kinase [Desulfuribacillus alkaliarsenatis]OEF95771.1 hypothetical protein BHF68_11780 [Desulfuribacillus alkaliarsenatis]
MLSKGELLTGAWHKHTYRVLHELGRGAIGVVYLVEKTDNGQLCAMKVAASMQSIAAEYKRLEKIQGKVQSRHFGPLLFELDDVQIRNQKLYYYTMEYITGESLKAYCESLNGHKSLNVHKSLTTHNKCELEQHQYLTCVYQIIENLTKLHKKNHIFCDLKPENVIIDADDKRAKFVDFGGVVPVGRMVKQYTVLYDRGSWKMGSRKADINYDLFAVGILLIQGFVGKESLQTAQKNPLPIYALYDIIHKKLEPKYKQICIKIFSEKYRSAKELQGDFSKALSLKNKVVVSDTYKFKSRTGFYGRIGKLVGIIDIAFWVSFSFMLGSIYLVLK